MKKQNFLEKIFFFAKAITSYCHKSIQSFSISFNLKNNMISIIFSQNSRSGRVDTAVLLRHLPGTIAIIVCKHRTGSDYLT